MSPARLLLAVLWMMALAAPAARAEEQVLPDTLGSPATAGAPSPYAGPDTAPVLPASAAWAGAVVIAIGGLFLAAAVVGPIVRAEAEPLPPTFSHHEDPTHHSGREPDPPHGAVE